MTEEQKIICNALGKVSYLPGTFDKRFGQNLHSLAQHEPEKELSEKQNEWMYRLLYKYRKQLPHTYERFKTNPLCSKKQDTKPSSLNGISKTDGDKKDTPGQVIGLF